MRDGATRPEYLADVRDRKVHSRKLIYDLTYLHAAKYLRDTAVTDGTTRATIKALIDIIHTDDSQLQFTRKLQASIGEVSLSARAERFIPSSGAPMHSSCCGYICGRCWMEESWSYWSVSPPTRRLTLAPPVRGTASRYFLTTKSCSPSLLRAMQFFHQDGNLRF